MGRRGEGGDFERDSELQLHFPPAAKFAQRERQSGAKGTIKEKQDDLEEFDELRCFLVWMETLVDYKGGGGEDGGRAFFLSTGVGGKDSPTRVNLASNPSLKRL